MNIILNNYKLLSHCFNIFNDLFSISQKQIGHSNYYDFDGYVKIIIFVLYLIFNNRTINLVNCVMILFF